MSREESKDFLKKYPDVLVFVALGVAVMEGLFFSAPALYISSFIILILWERVRRLAEHEWWNIVSVFVCALSIVGLGMTSVIGVSNNLVQTVCADITILCMASTIRQHENGEDELVFHMTAIFVVLGMAACIVTNPLMLVMLFIYSTALFAYNYTITDDYYQLHQPTIRRMPILALWDSLKIRRLSKQIGVVQ